MPRRLTPVDMSKVTPPPKLDEIVSSCAQGAKSGCLRSNGHGLPIGRPHLGNESSQGTRTQGRLEGKIAIIPGVGGKRGIGPATAERFLEEGCRLFVCDVDGDAAREFVRSIDRSGKRVHAVRADFTEEADVQQLVNACVEEFGPPDILVVNAGIARGMEILKTSLEDFEKNLDNLRGTFVCCKLACPLMRDGGSVIIVSTINALVGGAREGAYAAAKGGQLSFGRALAIELAPRRIRVNVVVPGTTETHGPNSAKRRQQDPLYFQHVGLATVPLEEVAQPRDVANLNLFLASDESAKITGQSHIIDGGTSVAGPYWAIGPEWPDHVGLYCGFLEEYRRAVNGA